MIDLDRDVRFRIYRHFARTGRAPSTEDLTAALTIGPKDVEESLGRLASDRSIVLAPGTHNIWMAHPFSAVPTPYPVRTATGTYWANCAWDALGICAILGVDGESETRCAESGEPLTIRVAEGRASPDGVVVHFLVPPKRFWENVGFT